MQTSTLRAAFFLAFLAPTTLFAASCPPDSVKVGTTCVDRYEASVWRIPTDSPYLFRKIRKGTVTLADLTAGGATQLGAAKLESCGGEYRAPRVRSAHRGTR